MTDFRILYRGPLASCNYGCGYCPFAKRRETAVQHKQDATALTRFVEWVAQQNGRYRLGIFFTPWGEALHHRRYQEAIVRLSRIPWVDKVAIQTNLSCRLEWLTRCDRSRVALWATYHPGEVARADFVAQVREVDRYGVALSVGIVGLQEHVAEAEAVRAALPARIYVWVNAYKRVPDYYDELTTAQLTAVDPLFPLNRVYYASNGRFCRAGETVFAVDGTGTMRRCHFIREPIGNIYAEDWETNLQPRRCTNKTCHCHIGYVHLRHLHLDKIFGIGILERIPRNLPLSVSTSE